MVSGHHVYKEICTSFVGVVLHMKQEPFNIQERLALAVIKDDILYVVDHVPRKFSHVIWHFIEHDETINCQVTGKTKSLYKCWYKVILVNAIPLYNFQFYLTGLHSFICYSSFFPFQVV